MQNTTAQQIGGNVRAEMARRNISQVALAAELGMSSQSMLSARLSGKPPFNVDELTRVAQILNVDVAVLMSVATTVQASA
jgi:transcriptional regulator with XRE-family HTH domain